jgi:hypothetical protein
MDAKNKIPVINKNQPKTNTHQTGSMIDAAYQTDYISTDKSTQTQTVAPKANNKS